MNIKTRVKQFITTNFYLPDTFALTDDVSFIDAGVIDSTSVLELTGFLEDEFGIEIDDEDLVPENLDSLSNVESFVTRKLKP